MSIPMKAPAPSLQDDRVPSLGDFLLENEHDFQGIVREHSDRKSTSEAVRCACALMPRRIPLANALTRS